MSFAASPLILTSDHYWPFSILPIIEILVSYGTFATHRKMDEIELSMFNKVYHTFLSNPVKINKKLHVSFEIMELQKT